MEFGYFTLSDNHYQNNPRTANDFVLEIRDQAVLADKLGYHSVWVGEHHFDSLGVNSRPDLLLASIAPLTKNVRFSRMSWNMVRPLTPNGLLIFKPFAIRF